MGLSEAQEHLADRVPVSDWSGLVGSPEGEFPRLRVAGLPVDALALPFREFLSTVTELGTRVIR